MSAKREIGWELYLDIGLAKLVNKENARQRQRKLESFDDNSGC